MCRLFSYWSYIESNRSTTPTILTMGNDIKCQRGERERESKHPKKTVVALEEAVIISLDYKSKHMCLILFILILMNDSKRFTKHNKNRFHVIFGGTFLFLSTTSICECRSLIWTSSSSFYFFSTATSSFLFASFAINSREYYRKLCFQLLYKHFSKLWMVIAHSSFSGIGCFTTKTDNSASFSPHSRHFNTHFSI